MKWKTDLMNFAQSIYDACGTSENCDVKKIAEMVEEYSAKIRAEYEMRPIVKRIKQTERDYAFASKEWAEAQIKIEQLEKQLAERDEQGSGYYGKHCEEETHLEVIQKLMDANNDFEEKLKAAKEEVKIDALAITQLSREIEALEEELSAMHQALKEIDIHFKRFKTFDNHFDREKNEKLISYIIRTALKTDEAERKEEKS